MLASRIELTEIQPLRSNETPSQVLTDDNLFTAHPRGLTIFDISDPTNPEEVGSHDNPEWEGPAHVAPGHTDGSIPSDSYNGVEVVDEYAYVAVGHLGVYVIDVSDPSNPTRVEHFEDLGRTYRVTGFDEYVYVLIGDTSQDTSFVRSLVIIDVSDPGDPSISGEFENVSGGEAEPRDFLNRNIRQIKTGQEFFIAWGRAGAYVAGIEWVDGTEDDAIAEEAPTPEANNQALPAIDTDDHTVYFPQQAEDVNEYDDGAPVGTLAMDDQGCLRFGDENGPVIIWPYAGFSVELVDREIALVNDETGNVIAHVGEEVSFHGSEPAAAPDSVPDHMLNGPLPEACADVDGYFVTGPGIGAT